MYRRGIVIRFLVIGLLFLGAMALFRAGVAHGYMMAAATGAEGMPISPYFPGGHFRPVGFGGAPLFFGFGLILIGLMVLGKGFRHHAWRHYGPRPDKGGHRRHGYPGWWGWYWYDEEKPPAPADRDKGEPAEQKV